MDNSLFGILTNGGTISQDQLTQLLQKYNPSAAKLISELGWNPSLVQRFGYGDYDLGNGTDTGFALSPVYAPAMDAQSLQLDQDGRPLAGYTLTPDGVIVAPATGQYTVHPISNYNEYVASHQGSDISPLQGALIVAALASGFGALGEAGALGGLGEAAAAEGAAAGTGGAAGLGTGTAVSGLGSGTAATGLGAGTAATNAGLSSFLSSGLASAAPGFGAGIGALDAGSLAGSTAGGSSMFDVTDPSTWDWGSMGTGDSGSYAADGSYLPNIDGAGGISPTAADTAEFWGTTASDVGGLANSPGISDILKQYGIDPMSSLAKSVLSSVLGGNGKVLGALGSSLLGYMGAKNQTSALKDQAAQYQAMGAPYRQKLATLYADPSSFLKDPSVTTSVDQGTNALMRSLSTQGNPWGSGNALQQGQDYATKGLYSQLGAEKDRLAGFGGLTAYNSAAPQAATNSIASSGNMYNAVGAGLGNIFNPPQTAAQQMTALAQAMRGNTGTGY